MNALTPHRFLKLMHIQDSLRKPHLNKQNSIKWSTSKIRHQPSSFRFGVYWKLSLLKIHKLLILVSSIQTVQETVAISYQNTDSHPPHLNFRRRYCCGEWWVKRARSRIITLTTALSIIYTGEVKESAWSEFQKILVRCFAAYWLGNFSNILI